MLDRRCGAYPSAHLVRVRLPDHSLGIGGHQRGRAFVVVAVPTDVDGRGVADSVDQLVDFLDVVADAVDEDLVTLFDPSDRLLLNHTVQAYA